MTALMQHDDNCADCNAFIRWCVTESGARIPMDVIANDDGNFFVAHPKEGDPRAIPVGHSSPWADRARGNGEPRFRPHVAVCGNRQQRLKEETAKRDDVLDDLEKRRASLIEAARVIAYDIAVARGEVSSVDVLDAMRDDPGLARAMHGIDRRFMGAVFRRGWRRLRWDPIGSHGRPVAVWAFKGGA